MLSQDSSARCSVPECSAGEPVGSDSQRVDVHPYEEAQGFQRLLDLPGYDVTALVEKSGKSASHIYARLSLLQLIPTVAEAFVHERITASHANLIARLPQDSQAEAFEQCWRKDWQDKDPHLLPAKHLSAWIQANLYLSLAEAPFDREDTTLNPAAGACVTCPRRSGFNTSLFADVQGDQCLDAPCFQLKVTAHIDREIAARPELIQIETAWRNPKEQRPGALQKNQYRELDIPDNPDAEPPCSHTKSALIVFGKHAGGTLTVCTEPKCPVHNPQVAAQRVTDPPPTIAPAPEQETEEEAAERQAEYEQRKADFERQQQEYEAEQARRTELRNARQASFERILANAPVMFTAPQLRVFLSALVNLDPYDFAEDVAAFYVGEDENNQQTAEEVLSSTIATLSEEKLTGFALRLVLTGHTDIPREGDFDFLAQAEAAFARPQTKKPKEKKPKPTVIKEAKASPKKTTPPKKKIAA
jgi:ParB family chromosome partitioning protein